MFQPKKSGRYLKTIVVSRTSQSTIKSSPIVDDIQSGLGAKRKCTFNDGSSLVEDIIEFNQGQGYKMDLSEYSYPLKSMFSEMRVIKIDANSSELFMSSYFS